MTMKRNHRSSPMMTMTKKAVKIEFVKIFVFFHCERRKKNNKIELKCDAKEKDEEREECLGC